MPGKIKPRRDQASREKVPRRGLAYLVDVERSYNLDKTAMVAALRVVLGPHRAPTASERGEANDGQDEGGSPVPASL